LGDHWILAIDFGSSNTAAAHTSPREPGKVEALPLTHAGNLLPSSVFVEPTGEVLAGAAAANRADADPAGFVPFPKRVVSQGGLYVRGVAVSAEDLVAAVLRSAFATGARRHGGDAPEAVVLTHPEAWGDRELVVLREAARRAGIDPGSVLFVSEPRAAATYYTAADRYAAGERLGVFDFGGGTLDIAVLEATGSGDFRVLSARGDNALGGRNLDALLRGWVLDELEDSDARLAESLRSGAAPEVLRALDASVRSAKEVLSEGSSASITVAAPGGHRSLLITRAEFDALISGEVERALELTRTAMNDAGASPHSLRSVFLTGGTSQVPLVHDRIASVAPVAVLDDPKTVVAQGALIGALRLRSRGAGASAGTVSGADAGFGQGAGMAAGQVGGAGGPAGASVVGGARGGAPEAPRSGIDTGAASRTGGAGAAKSRKTTVMSRRGTLVGGGVAGAIVFVAALVGGAYVAKVGPFAKDDGPLTPPATPQEFAAALPSPIRDHTDCESKPMQSESGTQLDGARCTFDATGMGIGDRTSLTFSMYAEGTSVNELEAGLGGRVDNPQTDKAAVSRLDSHSGDWKGYEEDGDGYTALTVLHPRSQVVVTDIFPGSPEVTAQFWEKSGFQGA